MSSFQLLYFSTATSPPTSQELLQMIAEDPRHRNVVIVYETEIEVRDFEGWAMAHYEFSDGDAGLRESFVKICQTRPEDNRNYPDFKQARKFVDIFRRMLSGSGG